MQPSHGAIRSALRLTRRSGEESRMSRSNTVPRLCTLAAFALAALGATAARAGEADDVNVVSAVETTPGEGGATVRIRGSRKPTFTVFRLERPSRVVLDLARTDASKVATGSNDEACRVAANPVLLRLCTQQFDDARAQVGRVVMSVAADTRYDVKADGNDVVVELRGAGQPAPAVAVAPAPEPAAPAALPPVDDKVVRVEVDSLPGGITGGTKLLSVRLVPRGAQAVLTLRADGPIARYEIVEIREPGRLALDLTGFVAIPKVGRLSAGPVAAVRIGRHDGHVRVVLEAGTDRFPPFDIRRTARGLVVSVGGAVAEPPAVAMTTREDETPAPAATVVTLTPETLPAPTRAAEVRPDPAPAARKPAPLAEIKSIDVSGKGRLSRIVVVLDRAARARGERGADGTLVLTIQGAKLPRELVRRLDARALEGPVVSLASYMPAGTDGEVRLVATLRDGESQADGRVQLLEVGPSHGIEWAVTGTAPRLLAALTAPARATGPGGFMGEAPAYAQAAGPRAGDDTRYTGKRVDFTAKDLDIIQFLQAIGEVSKRNIVASDDVGGTVSVRLRNVPWDEALDIVLRTKGLDKEEIGNIIRIAPAKTLQDEREQKAKAAEMKDKVDPLKVRLIPVNYATAGDIGARVKDILSARGTVSVDERTNMLIVKDTVDYLARAELLVRSLDTQTPQVMIESRIVEAATAFTRSLGIQWGGNVAATPANGNPTGLVFPNVVSIGGAATDSQTPTAGTSTTPNFAVNMPAPIGLNSGGGVGFIFGTAGGAATLNLRLSAAEVNGTIKTISAPKVTTMDNTAATISQGISIPFAQTSAAGVNTQFIEATLSLNVTPHVTADGSILLQVKASNNAPNPQLTGANGQPSISRREANTRVLVRDGDTTVIGGIYTRTTSINQNEVPFFSKIPIIGTLFRRDTETDDRTELLIFITPRIVNRQQSIVAGSEAQ